jgi:hypothetical protein
MGGFLLNPPHTGLLTDHVVLWIEKLFENWLIFVKIKEIKKSELKIL